MRQTVYVPRFALILFLVLILSACERPIPRDDTGITPTTGPIVVPPVDTPVIATPFPTIPVEAQPTVDPGQPTPGEEIPTTVPPEEATAPPQPEATAQPPTSPTSYTVQAGDTLFRISQRFNVPVQDIAAANNLTNVNVLTVGQVLTIPVPGSVPTAAPPSQEQRVHIVQAGENLFRIGLRYGFTVNELATYNNLANPNDIRVGQQILIPPSQ